MNRLKLWTIAAVTGLAVALASCGSAPSPSPVRSLGPGEMALPTFSTDSWLCAGGGFVDTWVLHGDPADPRVTWITGPTAERRDIAWPRGSSARFDLELEVLDPSGRVVAHEGSVGTGSCLSPDPHIWSVDFSTPRPRRQNLG